MREDRMRNEIETAQSVSAGMVNGARRSRRFGVWTSHVFPSPQSGPRRSGINAALPHRADPAGAFTRIELLAVSAALLLLALVVAPAAISQRSDASRQVCFNNLRLIGRGVMTWAADHTQQLPWRTPVGDGGTLYEFVKPGNTWFEYASLSNELVAPRILACPADVGVNSAGGSWIDFTRPQYRQNAVSYPLSMDGSMDAPRSWMSGDRNLAQTYPGGVCSARVNNTLAIDVPSAPFTLTWTNAVHGLSGHVLTTDGSVEFTSNARLRQIILAPGLNDNGQIHFLRAR